MSQNLKPLSFEEGNKLRELMARASTAGVEPGTIATSQWDMPTGSMTDASKRRCGAMDNESENCGYTLVDLHPNSKVEKLMHNKSQKPLPPTKGSKTTLPPGISSVENWGTTICQLPKVKALNLSYAELVNDPANHADYVKWVWDNGRSKGPSVADFFGHLQAIGYDPIKVCQDDLVPDSRVARKKKSST
eukprot:Skav234165  [mRNA]  locus=scaffold572:163472:164041:+ [translate_table: standard]